MKHYNVKESNKSISMSYELVQLVAAHMRSQMRGLDGLTTCVEQRAHGQIFVTIW